MAEKKNNNKKEKVEIVKLPEPDKETKSRESTRIGGQDDFVAFWQAERFDFTFLKNKVQYITQTLTGIEAATASNYGVFFIAPFPCAILSVREVHGTAGSDGGSVGLNIEKLTGTQALGSGVDVLSSDLSLKATANTVQEGVITTTIANRNLAKNERLALKDVGTLTAVADVAITIEVLYN